MIREGLTALALLAAVPVCAETAGGGTAPSVSLIGPALNVSDVDRSLHFYVDGLGLKLGTKRPGPQRTETILISGGGSLLLMSDARGAHPAIAQGNGFDRLVMRVASLDSTAAALKAAGFLPGPVHEAMNGMVRVMIVSDPDGYRLELVEMRRPTDRATP